MSLFQLPALPCLFSSFRGPFEEHQKDIDFTILENCFEPDIDWNYIHSKSLQEVRITNPNNNLQSDALSDASKPFEKVPSQLSNSVCDLDKLLYLTINDTVSKKISTKSGTTKWKMEERKNSISKFKIPKMSSQAIQVTYKSPLEKLELGAVTQKNFYFKKMSENYCVSSKEYCPKKVVPEKTGNKKHDQTPTKAESLTKNFSKSPLELRAVTQKNFSKSENKVNNLEKNKQKKLLNCVTSQEYCPKKVVPEKTATFLKKKHAEKIVGTPAKAEGAVIQKNFSKSEKNNQKKILNSVTSQECYPQKVVAEKTGTSLNKHDKTPVLIPTKAEGAVIQKNFSKSEKNNRKKILNSVTSQECYPKKVVPEKTATFLKKKHAEKTVGTPAKAEGAVIQKNFSKSEKNNQKKLLNYVTSQECCPKKVIPKETVISVKEKLEEKALFKKPLAIPTKAVSKKTISSLKEKISEKTVFKKPTNKAVSSKKPIDYEKLFKEDILCIDIDESDIEDI